MSDNEEKFNWIQNQVNNIDCIKKGIPNEENVYPGLCETK